MAYSGEIYPAKPFEFKMERPHVTYVSGAGPNIFGHALFSFGQSVGYIHVDEFYAFPKLMTPEGFSTYLSDNGKTVLHREYLYDLSNPQGSLTEAERLRKIKWFWAVVPHNCVAFAEQIAGAGGSQWTSKTNMPSVSAKVEKTRDSIKQSMSQSMNQSMKALDNIARYGRPF